MRNIVPGFGGRLRAARERRGWSQEQLAKRVQKTQVWISKLEIDRGAPYLSTALELAQALGVTIADLLPEGLPVGVPAIAEPVQPVRPKVDRPYAHLSTAELEALIAAEEVGQVADLSGGPDKSATCPTGPAPASRD